MTDTALKFRVEGRVQGVFFRAATRQQALQLGLRGYARNLPDGSVEVLASGPPAALVVFEAWLRHGPPQARVERVLRGSASAPDGEGFVTA